MPCFSANQMRARHAPRPIKRGHATLLGQSNDSTPCSSANQTRARHAHWPIKRGHAIRLDQSNKSTPRSSANETKARQAPRPIKRQHAMLLSQSNERTASLSRDLRPTTNSTKQNETRTLDEQPAWTPHPAGFVNQKHNP